jgi:hypothetical protein
MEKSNGEARMSWPLTTSETIVSTDACMSDDDEDDDGMIVHDDAHDDAEVAGPPADEESHVRSLKPVLYPHVSGGKPPVASRSMLLTADAQNTGPLISGLDKSSAVLLTSLDSEDGADDHERRSESAELKHNAETVNRASDVADDAPAEGALARGVDAKDKPTDAANSFRSPSAARMAQSSPNIPHMRSMSVDNIGPF